MKTQNAHAHEDRLLDFAYDELPASEARLVEEHLQACSRCTEALQGIRGVRTTMSRLAPEPPSDAGLESLLAYAQQSARRSAAGAQPSPRWWRRLLTPALGVAAVSVFGLVVLQVDRQVDLAPSIQQQKPLPKAEAVGRQDRQALRQALPTAPAPGAAPEPLEGVASGGLAPPPPPVQSAPARAARGYGESAAKEDSGGGMSFAEKKKSGRSRDEFEADKDGSGALGSVSSPSMVKGGGAPVRSPSKAAPVMPKPQSQVASEALADDAESTPGTAGAPMPSELPASPAPSARAEERAMPETQKAEAPPMDQMPMRRSLSAGEILTQADVAHRSGNWDEEVTFLRAALSAGVQGTRRVDVLSRLCEAEFARGNRSAAFAVCKQVISLAPGSSEARDAQRLLDDASVPAK